MSLFGIIKQSVSQVSDLISKQPVDSNSDLNSVNKSEKSNWFADLFNKPGTNTPGFNSSKQSLNQLSTNFLADKSSTDVEIAAQKRISERDSQEQNKASLEQQYVKNATAATVNLSGDDAPDGYVQVPVVLPHNYPTPMQESRAILTALKFKDSDIQAYNEHYHTDLVKDMSVGLGKNVNHNAGRRVYVPGEKKDVYVGYIAIDGKTHKNLKDFITARRSGGEFPTIENNTAKAKPSNIKLDPVTVTVLAGTGAGLATAMIETMPSQIATDIVPRAMEAGAKVAPLMADVAVPATMIAAEALPTVFIADHAAKAYMEAKDGFERGQAAQTYDLAREAAKATTLTMTAEPNLPQGVPPLIFPPPPLPLPGTVDQTSKVKTVTQTTLPIAPQIVTAAPGRSSQPIPPPPPFVFPNGIDHFNHLTQLWMSTSRDQALKDLFAEAAKGGVSIESGDEAVRFLDYCAKQQGVPSQNIQAVTIGGAIFVRPEFADNVRVLREEMIHTYQQAAGIGTNELVQGEIDARLQMIVNRHVWGIENNEVREMVNEVRKMRETGKY